MVILVILAGGIYYLRTTPGKPTTTNLPTPSINEGRRGARELVLQKDYSVKLVMPQDYTLKDGEGDVAYYIIDSKGQRIMSFYKGSAFGETNVLGHTIIDSVPFDINYREDIGCNADIEPSQGKTPPGESAADYLYFGINLPCENSDKEDPILKPVYEQIISSIKFSDSLKEVLLGKSYPPKLIY